MPSHVQQGFVGLSSRGTARSYTMLGLNLLSQLVCVSGVNQLSSVRDKKKSINILPPFATTGHPSPPGACLRRKLRAADSFFFSPLVPHLESIGRIDAGRPYGTQGD